MLVGIDVGGTKTHVRVVDDDAVLLDRVVPSADWLHGGIADDDANVRRLLGLIGDIAGAGEAPLVVGAHGLDTDAQHAAFSAALRAAHRGPARAVNDVELVAPAAGIPTAVAVIVGTGSKVVGHDAEGRTVSAGGYGHLLSDPGSAASLTRDAAKAVLDAHDAGEPLDALGHLLLGHFGQSEPGGLSYALTEDPRMVTWAAAAVHVFTAADAGSAHAARVIDAAAAELAASVVHVRGRGAQTADLVCAGGVITRQPRLFDALGAHVRRDDPGVRIHLLHEPPVAGAVVLAAMLSDQYAPAAPNMPTRRQS